MFSMKSLTGKIFAAVMAAVLLTGCASSTPKPIKGGDTDEASSYAGDSSVSESVEEATDSINLADTLLGKEGKVLNIYCCDRDLLNLFKQYYPAYERPGSTASEAMSDAADLSGAASTEASTESASSADDKDSSSAENSGPDAADGESAGASSESGSTSDTDASDSSSQAEEETKDGVTTVHGKIGTTEIRWTIIENDLQKYEDALDDRLFDSDAKADERVDFYEVPGQDLTKYADADAGVSKTLSKVGLYSNTLSDQFDFTRSLGSDADGKQRAITWQMPAGCFIYRRDYAKAALGTDDPAEVQKKLDSWKHISETAATLAQHGYQIFTGYQSPMRAFLNQRSEAWVDEDDELIIDKVMNQYVNQMKDFANHGYVHDAADLTDEVYRTDVSADSHVFGQFMTSAQLSEFMLSDADAASRWGVVNGPASFWNGGNYFLIGTDNDNPSVTSEILRDVILNQDVLTKITEKTGVLTNSKSAMKKLENDENFSFEQVGGQNYISDFETSANRIDTSLMTYYDSTLEDCFISAFLPYFRGTTEKTSAIHNFYQLALKKYPDLLNS